MQREDEQGPSQEKEYQHEERMASNQNGRSAKETRKTDQKEKKR